MGSNLSRRIHSPGHHIASFGRRGIRPQDRVALIQRIDAEWSIVELSRSSARCGDSSALHYSSVEQIEFILRDSGARASRFPATSFETCAQGIRGLTQLETIVCLIRKHGRIRASNNSGKTSRRGSPSSRADAGAFDKLIGQVHADDLATIITLGTTGERR